MNIREDDLEATLLELRRKSKQAIDAGRLSYVRLAAELGVSEAAARRYVAGQRKRISWEVLARWADFMGMSLPLPTRPLRAEDVRWDREADRIADRVVAKLGDLIAQALREILAESRKRPPKRGRDQGRHR